MNTNPYPDTRAHERADVIDFIRHPPGRVPDHMRAFLAELVIELERGAHVGSARRLYSDLPEDEQLPEGWTWSSQDPEQATGPDIVVGDEQVRRFVTVVDDMLEFQYQCDSEPLDVVRAVLARHDRLHRTHAVLTHNTCHNGETE